MFNENLSKKEDEKAVRVISGNFLLGFEPLYGKNIVAPIMTILYSVVARSRWVEAGGPSGTACSPQRYVCHPAVPL